MKYENGTFYLGETLHAHGSESFIVSPALLHTTTDSFVLVTEIIQEKGSSKLRASL
jgi:hypothetical protein